ncbi:putative regulatory protein, FmdB family [compost metagenome]
MPIYEYQCASCGHQLETLQKFSDAPLVDCPTCHAPELTKMLSLPGFRLKGGGWYETDFKTGAKKNLAGDAAPACPATGCGSGACAAAD